MKKAIIATLLLVPLIAAVVFAGNPTDHRGFISYLPDHTYQFYINQTSRTITLQGVNASNINDNFVIGLNADDTFTTKVNNIWFHGWYDATNLHVNQYVPLGITHTLPATHVAPVISAGVNTAQFSNSAFIPTGLLASVSHNTQTQESSLAIFFTPFFTTASINSQTGEATHILGPYMILSRAQGTTTLILEEWMKADLATNGVTPSFTGLLLPA